MSNITRIFRAIKARKFCGSRRQLKAQARLMAREYPCVWTIVG
jgi:hypothetical protein